MTRHGARVALIDIDHVNLRETAQLCAGEVKDYAADVTGDPAPGRRQVRGLVRTTMQTSSEKNGA